MVNKKALKWWHFGKDILVSRACGERGLCVGRGHLFYVIRSLCVSMTAALELTVSLRLAFN